MCNFSFKSHKSRWKGLAWAPCIEDDKTNGVVLKNSYELLKRGTFNRVPLMTGFNSLEARDVNIRKYCPDEFLFVFL